MEPSPNGRSMVGTSRFPPVPKRVPKGGGAVGRGAWPICSTHWSPLCVCRHPPIEFYTAIRQGDAEKVRGMLKASTNLSLGSATRHTQISSTSKCHWLHCTAASHELELHALQYLFLEPWHCSPGTLSYHAHCLPACSWRRFALQIPTI